MLFVKDKGIGLPDAFTPETASTLGMQVITGLTKQIRGRLEITKNTVGAEFRIWFKPEPLEYAQGRGQ